MYFYSNQVRSYTFSIFFPQGQCIKKPWLMTRGSSDKETPPKEVRPSALSLRIRRRSQHSTSHGCSKHSWRWHPKAVFLEIQTPFHLNKLNQFRLLVNTTQLPNMSTSVNLLFCCAAFPVGPDCWAAFLDPTPAFCGWNPVRRQKLSAEPWDLPFPWIRRMVGWASH